MRAFRTSKWTVGLLAFFLLCGRTLAQAPSALEETGLGRQETSNVLPSSAPESTGKQQESTAEQTKLPSPSTITLPAGTRILMALKSPLHTTSAVAGSGLYLETVSPVVQENHVAIPVMTQVLGTVDGDKRPGRVQGRAQFHFRFTNLVFANNYVLPIDGALQSLPGNKKVRTQDAEGTIQPVDQIDDDVVTLAKGSVLGFLVGTFRGGTIKPTGNSAIGTGIGAGLALGKVLFTRGDEIQLDSGSLVEMVLEHPVSVELEHVPSNAEFLLQSRYALPEVNRSPGRSAVKPPKSRLSLLRWLWLLYLVK